MDQYEMMTRVIDYIDETEKFIENLSKILKDNTESVSRKQTLVLDNTDKIAECFDNLDKMTSNLEKFVAEHEDDNDTDMDAILDDVKIAMKKCEHIKEKLKNTMKEFKDSVLNINRDTTLEENTVKVDEDTISDAMKNNKTTQQISQDMNDIVNGVSEIANEAEERTSHGKKRGNNKVKMADYALVANGKTVYINAADNTELNNKMQKILNGYDGPDVFLYKISYKEVKLKTKTVYSI